jgi:hypothetical protein
VDVDDVVVAAQRDATVFRRFSGLDLNLVRIASFHPRDLEPSEDVSIGIEFAGK